MSKLDLAEAQFIGYYFRKRDSNGIIGLVKSMGLTKKEWVKLKPKNPLLFDEFDITEIDDYFKNK